MTWEETANRCVEIEQTVQEAMIEYTGDVTDPGPLAGLSAALSTLAVGDEDAAKQMFLDVAQWIATEEIEGLKAQREDS